MAYGEFYVEQQGWAHWPKVLIMCRKNGRGVTRRRYVPEVETGEGMSITEELRTEARGFGDYVYRSEQAHRLLAIADRIDERVTELLREHDADLRAELDAMNDGWTRLPVDADGEVIHVGDKLDGYGKTIEVVELRYGRSGWVLISRDGNAYADTFAFTHHHAPTVEDVLRDMHMELDEVTALYVGEAIDSDERDRDEARIFAKYASKLRLAGEDA